MSSYDESMRRAMVGNHFDPTDATQRAAFEKTTFGSFVRLGAAAHDAMKPFAHLMHTILDALVLRQVEAFEDEARSLGITEANAHEYEKVDQWHDGVLEYRGIRKDGVWLVDHHPDWPEPGSDTLNIPDDVASSE